MKKLLALVLCLLLLVPTAALPTFVASADIEGRIIQEFTVKGSVNKTMNNDYMCTGSSYLKEPVDLSGYALKDLALELDLYLEGDLAAFQSNINAWVELTSSGKADAEELNWNIGNMTWQSEKWFRLTLKLSNAGKNGTIDLSKVNYIRMYVYSAGGVGKTYTFKYCNFRLVDLSKGEVGTDMIGDGTFKVTPPEWQLVETEYPTTEGIIAAYNLGDYLPPDTDMDATPVLQTLLDAAGAGNGNNDIRTGGGTVFVPSGTYTFKGTIMIPYGVTLQGDWRAPTDENPEAVGTIFKVYSGRGNDSATPFVTMLPNTAVDGITFWYPEQDPENIVEYPVTVRQHKEGNWGSDYTHVRNCTFVNSYRAVQQGPNGSGCPNVYNVYGTPLYLGVYMDNIGDIGRFDYMYFGAKYWENCGLPGAPTTDAAKTALRTHLRENATALMVGRVDWSYWCFSEIEGYHIGMYYVESEGDANPGAYSNGHVYDMTFTDCDSAIRINGCSTGAAQLFSNIRIKDCTTGIYTYPEQTAIGNLNMSNITIDADTAIRHDGNMRLFVSTFDILRGGVEVSGGIFTMSGTTFQTAAPQVTLKQGATSVILQGNKAVEGEFKVDNPSLCPVQISNKPAAIAEDIEWMTGDQSRDETVRPAREELYVAELDNSGKTDITEALQALLDKAGNEGGGYVFLPPGHYRLNRYVTIPTGVELVGSVNVGRNPVQCGTILDVYGRTGAATIIMSEGSGLRGIVLDYPEQGNLMSTLKSYPYAVQGRGKDIYIVNFSVRNAYDGIDLMSYKCDNHYVKYFAGYCFHSAMKIGGGAVGGKVINYQMNSSAWWNGDESKFGSWKNVPTDAQKASPTDTNPNGGGAWQLNNVYVQGNCVILTVGDVTDQVLYNNFSYLGAVGVYYVEENGQSADGWNVGNAYDYTSVGIKVDAIEKMDFINPQIVSYNHTGKVGDTYHMYLTDKCDDEVNIINVACWAQPHNFIRVDSGTLNVYCGTYTADTKTKAFATIGEKGIVNLQNGAISNKSVNLLAGENLRNLTVEGYINERTFGGEDLCNWGTNMVRVNRWDVPQNATIDKTQKMAFTEAFTDYKVDAVEGIGDVLNRDGSFSSLSSSNANGHITRVDVDGNHMMRMYQTGGSQSVFARLPSLKLGSGQVNNLYMLEFRVNVKSLREAEDARLALTVYNTKGTLADTPVEIVSFKADGMYVGDMKVAEYTKDTWYRLQVTFDLRDPAHKSYQVFLYDDDYTYDGVVLENTSMPFSLPEAYQNSENDIGMISLVAEATRSEDESVTDVLVDYLFVTQDPTVVEEPVGMLGDVDGDGSITSTDARLTLQFYAGKIGEEDLNVALADVDGDSAITSTDARLILQMYAGKIEKFPAEA